MQHSAEMRRCLIDCDVAQMRKLDQHVMPHLTPMSDGEVLITIHLARTVMNSIPFKLRAYSHRWLTDHGYPSKLPDHLKSKAERIYPSVIDAVGVAVKGGNMVLAKIVQGEMSDAVMDCYADKKTEPTYVKRRIMEVKDITLRKLLGRK